MSTLPAFTVDDVKRVKLLLADQVARMMGRKLEEGDWSEVYCRAKNIPDSGWSNINIDVNYNGLGIEFKMLRILRLQGKSIKSVCGTSQMHPAATRSIRIDDVDRPPDTVMVDVLTQYAELIDKHTDQVRKKSGNNSADMRFGWLLWETELREFLYFEEVMAKPDPASYYATWNETPARGARKPGKSLWIFSRATGMKQYSVTTSAGIKIQPYFNVPPPDDPNLVYLRVQSEPLDEETISLWVTAETAERLKLCLGSTDKDVVSNAVFNAVKSGARNVTVGIEKDGFAVPIRISRGAFDALINYYDAVSDEHRIQKLIATLDSDAMK